MLEHLKKMINHFLLKVKEMFAKARYDTKNIN